MIKPEDPKLQGLVEGIVMTTAIGLRAAGQMFLIDKEYQIRGSVLAVGDLAASQATRLRQRLLASGELLAVVMTGVAADAGGQVVCQYFPAPGQVEVFALTYPIPRVSWADQDDPETQDAIEMYQETWRLGALR